MHVFLVVLAVIAGLVGISYLLEELRSAPAVPARLRWSPTLTSQYVDADGVRVRYVEAGTGPALVLLHTLRTQLDMFQQVLPRLAAHFHIYALDLPGHGYSDIPNAEYTADFFVATIAKALDRLEIDDAVVAGESIGGTVALLLAARHHPRVRAVIAINPYDYAGGRGIRRSSLLANMIFGLNNVPIVGATVNRLRTYPVFKRILEGGVHSRQALPAPLAREMYEVGNRRGYGRAFSSLVRNWASWEAARREYRHIDHPALLIYGDHDWSHRGERAATAGAIPGAEFHVIRNAGHFLSLDAPGELAGIMLEWAAARSRETLAKR